VAATKILEQQIRTGRGAARDLPNRFEVLSLDLDPDVVQHDPSAEGESLPNPKTIFLDDHSESIIVRNQSPDVGFSAGINPYRGCEHGCAYCYARPSHEYLGFSAGLEFETKIMVKRRAAELLRRELSAPKYRPEALGMSGITDCYQPAERHFRLTRSCLEVLAEFRNPVSIITKNFLVTRDLDLLKELAEFDAVHVFVSITTLNQDLAAKMEPRASRPSHRLRAVEMLAKAGVPVGVMAAPIIPGLNDVFQEWLKLQFPEKLERILGTVREVRGGKLNSSEFGSRMRGEGPYAEQIHQMFHVFRERLGFGAHMRPLDTSHFRRPGEQQLSLGIV
jgi:DNA repair photolyase